MKIYVASSWRNESQPAVVRALRDAGHSVYDFRNPAPGNRGFGWRQARSEPPPWSAATTRDVLAHPVAEAGFALDFDAMRWADAVVMVQPCGRSAALELGWGVGAGKLTLVLLADGQEPELMLKAADRLCVTINEVVRELATADGQRRRSRTTVPLEQMTMAEIEIEALATAEAIIQETQPGELPSALVRMMVEAVRREREECASLADAMARESMLEVPGAVDALDADAGADALSESNAATELAARIRARGESRG